MPKMPDSMQNSMQNPVTQIKETPCASNEFEGNTTANDGLKSRPSKSSKTLLWNAFWPGLALSCLIVPALPIFGGCMFIQAPEPEPTPTPVPTVVPHPDVYTAAPEATNVQPLTDDTPTDNGGVNLIPDYYQVVGADSGDQLTLQAMRLTKEGVPFKTLFDKPVKVKLGGIICPLQGEPGWAESRGVALNWLGGRQLQVDQDKKYPIALNGRNIVQIRIKSETKKKDAAGNVTKTEDIKPFNQLLVRAGYAFVDLISPTSFDYKTWIIDQEYARGVRTEVAEWQLKNAKPGVVPTPAPGIPVGLWARGIFPNPDWHPSFRTGGPAHSTPVTIIVGQPIGGLAGTKTTKTTTVVGKTTAQKIIVAPKTTTTKTQVTVKTDAPVASKPAVSVKTTTQKTVTTQ